MKGHVLEKYKILRHIINEEGVAKVTNNNVKKYDSGIPSFLYREHGGMVAFREAIMEGKININAIIAEGEKAAETREAEELRKEKEKLKRKLSKRESEREKELIFFDEVEAKEEEVESIEIPFSEGFNVEEIFCTEEPVEDTASIGDSIDRMSSSITKALEIISLNQEGVIEALKALSVLPEQVKSLSKRLSTLEELSEQELRKKCHDLALKLSFISYGSNDGTSIKKTYSDIYSQLNVRFGFNVEMVRQAEFSLENKTRVKEGKETLQASAINSKGFKKIDIIEKYGMITELYLLIKDMIKEESSKGIAS